MKGIKMSRSARFIGCILIAVCFLAFLLTAAGHAEIVRSSPPAVGNAASIPLSGKTPNSDPESWITLDDIPISAGIAHPTGGARRIVWNVGRGALLPFLPNPRRATGAAMIVLPGGSFTGLAIDQEGIEVAHWLNRRGIAAFVLKYRVMPMPRTWAEFVAASSKLPRSNWIKSGDDILRVSNDPERSRAVQAAQDDGIEAMMIIRRRASEWHISPKRIGIIGFSAGAVTAIKVALNAPAAARPDLLVSAYGALIEGQRAGSTPPPAFFVAAADDAVCPMGASLTSFKIFQTAGAASEIHIFQDGGHGFGVMHQGKSSDRWVDDLDAWLRLRGFAAPKSVSQ
jgi:acetyl esterase/lipase